MIERYLLRYFLAVVDQGNFSRAARQCRVSQPTLSVGIAKLERDLGSTLIERTSRRVQLTGDGVRFLNHARRIEMEFLAAEASSTRENRELLRLGFLSTIPTAWLETALGDANVHWLTGGVEIIEGRSGELRAKLDRGRIDAAITLLESPAPGAAPLYTERFGLAVNLSHPLADRASVTAEEVADHVMLVRRQCEMLSATSQHFTVRGIRPFMAAKTMSDERALAMVRSGLGVTVVPESYGGDGVKVLPIAGFGAERVIGTLVSSVSRPLHAQSSTALGTIVSSLASLAARHGLVSR